MRPHPLTNFEIQKNYQNEPKLNVVYLRNKLHKIQIKAYILNLDEYKSIGTHWIALYVNDDNLTYFGSFAVEHIPKEIKKVIENKVFTTNIFRIKAQDSKMCEYFCIGFIDFI